VTSTPQNNCITYITGNNDEIEQTQRNRTPTPTPNMTSTMNHAATSPFSPLNIDTGKQQHQQEIHSLKEQIKLIQGERDSLREDINEVVQTRGLNRNKTSNIASSQHHIQMVERKYQVELDSMRQVAGQVQAEADEKVALVEITMEQMKKKLEVEEENHRCKIREKDELLHERGRQLQQREKEEKEDKKDRVVWKDSFKSLVEQLCFHTESGALEWNANLSPTTTLGGMGMSEVVLAAVASEEAREEVKREMGDVLHSLSIPRSATTTRKPSADSCVQTDEEHLPMPLLSLDREGGKEGLIYEIKDKVQSISVAVDTADLPAFAHLNSNTNDAGDAHSDRHYYGDLLQNQHCHNGAEKDKEITELQFENASLRGTNEHLTDQFQLCRKQLQSLKESSELVGEGGPFISPSSASTARVVNSQNKKTAEEGVAYFSTLVNQLQRSNAQHTQSNEMLTENIQILEEENSKVVQRRVDMERLVEEAATECEHLSHKIDQLEQDNGRLAVEKVGVVAKLECLRNEQKEVLERLQMERVTMEEELMERINILDRDLDEILEAKKALDLELASLVDKNSHLVSDANEAEKQVKCLSAQLEGLQEKSKIWEEEQDVRDNYTSLCKKNEEVEQELSSVLKNKLEVEDEYTRLRNVNSLTKAKMQQQESELTLLKKTNKSLKREGSDQALRLESTRAENVTLADGNTDVEVECSRLKKECEDLHKLLNSGAVEEQRMRHEAAMLQNECSIAIKHKEDAERICKEAQDRSSCLTTKVKATEIELDNATKSIEVLTEEKEERDKLLVVLQEELDVLKKLKEDKEYEYAPLQQEIKKVQELNDKLNETIDEMTGTKSDLEEKLCNFELTKSSWAKTKIDTDMEAKLELLNLECTLLKDTNEGLQSDISNLNKEMHSMSAATEKEKDVWEKSRINMESKLEILNSECTSLKDTNEGLRSDISNHDEMHSISTTTEMQPGILRQPATRQVENTPLAPRHITDRQAEVAVSIQTPITIDNVIMSSADGQRVNRVHTSTKAGLSTIPCLFTNQLHSVGHGYNSVTPQRVEATVEQATPLSGQSMDERLERLKLANQRASRKLRHASSTSSAPRIRNKNVTPLIVKPAVNIETANKNQRTSSCKAGNSPSVSIQETEKYIMDILNSCEKSLR